MSENKRNARIHTCPFWIEDASFAHEGSVVEYEVNHVTATTNDGE